MYTSINEFKTSLIVENQDTNQEPINLLETSKFNDEYRELFNEWSKDHTVVDTNEELGLSKGDVILFKNGFGIEMISEILGFDEIGKAYMLWDCYWFAIDLKERLIKKI